MSDDLISRQAAIDFIKDHSYPVRYNNTSIEQGMTITGIEQALNEMPIIQPKQKTGRWSKQMLFDDGYGGKKVGYICSACRKYVPFKGNYCGNCGAKMESDDEATSN